MIRRTPIKRSGKPRAKRPGGPRRGRLSPEGMGALRRAVFERDGYLCQHVTGEYVDLEGDPHVRQCYEPVTWKTGHLAHITSRGAGGHDTLENCTTKCAFHHAVVEHTYGKSGVKPCPPKGNG